jgi:dynein heavy chain, axonemal
MYIFGGYGGAGFARRDFNDVHVLDLETWEWRHVECKGEVPEPRSGHQVINSSQVLLLNGVLRNRTVFPSAHLEMFGKMNLTKNG